MSDPTEKRLLPEGAFVLQVFCGAGNRAFRFSGRVEHVVTGRAARFGTSEELHRFVAQALADSKSSNSEPPPDDAVAAS